MSRRGIRLGAVVALAALAMGLGPGCGKRDDYEKVLRGAIVRTERLSGRFVYRETSGREVTTVNGIVEDDLRSKTQVAINGQPVLEEIIRDDAAAVRLFEPAVLTRFVESADLNTIDLTQRRGVAVGVGVEDALKTGQWVLDASGAPPLSASAAERHPLGDDPVFDSLDVLNYVERAMDEGAFVGQFNEESLEYRASEDPFPRPKRHSGVQRYDVIPPRIPAPSAEAGQVGGRDEQIAARHLRKMSVYVKDGRVLEVREVIGASGRLLDRLLDVLKRQIELFAPEFLGEYEKELEATPASKVPTYAMDVLNFGLQAQGADLVRPRSMVLRLFDFGLKLSADLPTESVVGGNLDAFKNLGKEVVGAEERAAAAARLNCEFLQQSGTPLPPECLTLLGLAQPSTSPPAQGP